MNIIFSVPTTTINIPMDMDLSSPSNEMEEEETLGQRTTLVKADSWDDNSESVATTPDDEEAGGEESFVPASKPRTKVKPKQEEAHTTEKEHVNVVFIGHVGKKNIYGWKYSKCLKTAHVRILDTSKLKAQFVWNKGPILCIKFLYLRTNLQTCPKALKLDYMLWLRKYLVRILEHPICT